MKTKSNINASKSQAELIRSVASCDCLLTRSTAAQASDPLYLSLSLSLHGSRGESRATLERWMMGQVLSLWRDQRSEDPGVQVSPDTVIAVCFFLLNYNWFVFSFLLYVSFFSVHFVSSLWLKLEYSETIDVTIYFPTGEPVLDLIWVRFEFYWGQLDCPVFSDPIKSSLLISILLYMQLRQLQSRGPLVWVSRV